MGLGRGSSHLGQSHARVWFTYAAANLVEPIEVNDSGMIRIERCKHSWIGKSCSVDGVTYSSC